MMPKSKEITPVLLSLIKIYEPKNYRVLTEMVAQRMNLTEEDRKAEGINSDTLLTKVSWILDRFKKEGLVTLIDGLWAITSKGKKIKDI